MVSASSLLGQRHFPSPAKARLVDLLSRRKNVQEGSHQKIPQHAAQSIRHQIIHVKQAIASRIDKIQSRQLGQLKKKRQQKGQKQGLLQMTAEIVTQIDAKGHCHHNVEKYLEEGPVDNQRNPASRIRCHKMGFLENITDKMKWYQLRPRPGHSCHLLYGGKRQNDQKEDAEHIEHKRIYDQNAHTENRTVLAIIVEHIGQCEKQRDQREKEHSLPDHFQIYFHGFLPLLFFLKVYPFSLKFT